MHLLVSLFVLALPCAGGTFAVMSGDAGSWPAVLSSVGHVAGSAADIFVAPPGTAVMKIPAGAALILEGTSPLAESLGFHARAEKISVIHVVDVHNDALPVIWEKAMELPRFDVPAGARVFAKDRWTGAPLIAGKASVLWVAANPGPLGYERFPYLMQALADLGFAPSFRSSRLWAFFDYSYRMRADPDYLAAKWRAAGISALHVASWHFYDEDAARDEYLKNLIEACHRHGVLVYAWVELPHVSEKFWADHPAWREKTAALQDAQLDWRKLMNLENRECVAAIRAGLKHMTARFDWDGVNLAELYFESLEGAGNPARFTPMNDDVRTEFRAQAGWDPIEIWGTHNDKASLRRFLDYRADLVKHLQEDWLGTVESFREFRPDLDVVLTHVDDRFDAGMRDSIGADVAKVLPLLDTHKFSFLIEDPATVWNLGPQRYPEIAKRYRPLTGHTEKLAIDINIVDRYQDVYPTKQQTGTELFELVHLASAAFSRVALYFENSILKPDLGLLGSSSAVVTRFTREKARVTIDAAADVQVKWDQAGALVDGKVWPVKSSTEVWLPAGMHTIEPSPKRVGIGLIDLNAKLRSASAMGEGMAFDYSSDSRAIARFDRKPARVEVDGLAVTAADVVLLPRGDHRVRVE